PWLVRVPVGSQFHLRRTTDPFRPDRAGGGALPLRFPGIPAHPRPDLPEPRLDRAIPAHQRRLRRRHVRRRREHRSMAADRKVTVERKTAETKIELTLSIDGTGRAKVDTGVPFFDHMLTLFAKHGLFDLEVRCDGDVDVDYHHTVEDVGLVLGD